VRVHLAGEHPLELETLDVALDPPDIGLDGPRGGGIVLGFREREQLTGLGQPGTQPIERVDDALESRALAAELLRAILIVPDRRILELAEDLGEALAAAFIVKDTP
jgi:hypothetical protein